MTATLTDFIDTRSTEPHTKPVWEKKLMFVTAAGQHVKETIAIPMNGILQKIIMVVPATQATGKTVTLTIDDNNDFEIFSSGAKAENDDYVFNVSEPLAGTVDVSIDLNDTPGTSDHTTTVYLRGI